MLAVGVANYSSGTVYGSPQGLVTVNASRAEVRARSKQVHAMATAAAHSAVASARKVRSVDREMRWR
jgi:hypothetical protein